MMNVFKAHRLSLETLEDRILPVCRVSDFTSWSGLAAPSHPAFLVRHTADGVLSDGSVMPSTLAGSIFCWLLRRIRLVGDLRPNEAWVTRVVHLASLRFVSRALGSKGTRVLDPDTEGGDGFRPTVLQRALGVVREAWVSFSTPRVLLCGAV